MKILISLVLVLLTQTTYAQKYSGCKDPKYGAYVEKRLEFYQQYDQERYEKAQLSLVKESFNNLNIIEKNEFLTKNTILSAQFDTSDVASSYIKHYEKIEQLKPFFAKSGYTPHLINIARGWVALNEGKQRKAIDYLLASTDTKGSPVLNSFGPDMTLVRALYQQGNKDAVLEYLNLAQSFWNTDSAKNNIQVWRKMIRHNCAIQFQFYDTTSIIDLGL